MKSLLITVLLFLSLAAVALGGNTKSKPHNEVFVPPTPEEEAKATKDFTFGDIIEFPYKHKGVVPFKHYGVFVGNHHFQTTREKQGPHDTLFHFSESETGMKCQFSTVLAAAEGGTYQKKNLHDGKDGWQKNTDEKMVEIITFLANNGCGDYKLLRNNCEHVSTYVRYSQDVSKQAQRAKKIIRCLDITPTGNRPKRWAASIKYFLGLA